MSNPLAIAGVTAVIRDLLADGLIDADLDAVGGVTVSSLPLEQILAQQQQRNRLNVLFTHATPNSGWTNSRLPNRDNSGALVSRPMLALDLHYLITAIGLEDFVPEALLGYAMHLLHEQPVLGAAAIRRSLGQGAVDGGVLPPLFQNLAAADLADQVESIRITPRNPDPEQWSQIWSSMNVGLRASAVYTASVVLIEGTATPRSALPVIEGRLAVRTIRRPNSCAGVRAARRRNATEHDGSDVSRHYAVAARLGPSRRTGNADFDWRTRGCSGTGKHRHGNSCNDSRR